MVFLVRTALTYTQRKLRRRKETPSTSISSPGIAENSHENQRRVQQRQILARKHIHGRNDIKKVELREIYRIKEKQNNVQSHIEFCHLES